jgi:hypothetical protein
MQKPTLNHHSINYQNVLGYGFAMTMFCLLVSWGIEELAREFFRLT